MLQKEIHICSFCNSESAKGINLRPGRSLTYQSDGPTLEVRDCPLILKVGVKSLVIAYIRYRG